MARRRVSDVGGLSEDIQQWGRRQLYYGFVRKSRRNVPGVAAKSASLDAELVAARAFEERRFRGPIGSMVAAEQQRVLANMIGRIHERTVLDVGTGFGRTAIALALGAAEVTALDSSEALLNEAGRRAAAQVVKVNLVHGDPHALQFKARAFDAVVCMGVLQSARDWYQCLAEACRVADRLVVFDYPSARSVALVHSGVRRLLRREKYRVLRRSVVEQALQRSQFRIRSVHRQYVLPMWFHRAIGSRRFTSRLEEVLDRIGLRRRWGTPVTICAERAG
jgi:ubiquinone/menaquinone biosynthesis C-methylase UbiE